MLSSIIFVPSLCFRIIIVIIGKTFTAPINAVLAVKSARVSDFGGKRL